MHIACYQPESEREIDHEETLPAHDDTCTSAHRCVFGSRKHIAATASYSIHILAEDWGCVADRVILSLDKPIDDASAYEYTVSRR